jgi:phage tail-like protein
MNDQPARNRYLLLDSVVGWRASALDHLTQVEPSGDLQADAIPGLVQSFGTKALASIKCPSAVDIDACATTLYVLDRATAGVYALPLAPLLAADSDPDACTAAARLRGIGGKGAGVRHLRNPHGLAVLADGSIAIADTGNGRVQLFSDGPHALLMADSGFDQPWGVVAGRRGSLVIADRTGLHAPGSPQLATLQNATELAISHDGLLAVAAGGHVVLIGDGPASTVLPDVSNATSVAFDDDANLYVGTGDGLIWKFAPLPPGGATAGQVGAPAPCNPCGDLTPPPPRPPSLAYRLVGVGVTGRDGAVLHLRFHTRVGLLAILREPSGARIWRIDPAGGFVNDGVYVTKVLDSGIESCEWHRVELRGTIPDGASIEVTTETADDVTALTGTFARQPSHLLGATASEATSDCLVVSDRGRYLRLRLHFRSSGIASPIVHAVRIDFPRASYLQYLPAVYQDDPDSREFLARFLSIFQTSLDRFDRRIDDLWQLFDPHAAPAAYLPWLAGWMALPLDPGWSEAHTRDVLSRAWQEAQRRGTVAGLEQAIVDYAGVRSASVVEHFRLRGFTRLGDDLRTGKTTRLWSRGYYARLQLETWSRVGYFRLTDKPEPEMEIFDYGANEFSVFFLTSPYTLEDDQKRVARVVEREKPAHTRATICPVLPRFRVGVQSTLGVDSVVGDVSHLVLGKLATLGYDSILAGFTSPGPGARAAPSQGNSRAGVNTRLL